MTITTNNNELLKIFEPKASLYEERVECLKYLFEKGCRTAVMMEPYLGSGNTETTIEHLKNLTSQLLPYCTEVLVIGDMNYKHLMKENKLSSELKKYLEDLYSNETMWKIYEEFKDKEKIFFKHGFFDTVLKKFK